MKRRGIFFKVFTYTTIFIILLVCVTVALFSQQFMSFYTTTQNQQLFNSYQGLYGQMQGKNREEVAAAAERFYENNQSFSFFIKDGYGDVVFSTPDIDPEAISNQANIRILMTVGGISQEYILCATNIGIETTDYRSLAYKSLFALAIMLALGVACAYIFVRQMTKPIKRLADDTKRMAKLEDVLPAPGRSDELGDLARDVHAMYDKLKITISRLEDEILRRREMEETQRYFFSAASHELKTPIAATSVLLEGMIEDVGDYRDHRKYLKECIKMMDAQNKTVTEILEIVNLNDGRIIPRPEKLDIKKLVTGLLASFQMLTEANGQGIRVDISESQVCLADKKMLEKAISNVILNAVQNTPPGKDIFIWTEPVADQYRLFIHNTGVNISEDLLPKLFDPFFRIDKARTRRSGRSGHSYHSCGSGQSGHSCHSCGSGQSGLGLALVEKTFGLMGFDFSLENIPEGVVFWVDLPEI